MHITKLVLSTTLVAMLLNVTSFAEAEDEALNLDEASERYNYFGGYSHNPKLTGYGTGGYGDATTADFNLNVCRPGQAEGMNCTAHDPDLGIAQWRFIPNIGWRKFSKYGAARKDWWEYKKTLRWPFTNYQKYGYNWW